MLRIHTADGKTLTVDLADESQAREWLPRLARADYQRSISGVTLVEEHGARASCPECGARCSGLLGIQTSVSRPQDFRRIEVDAELVEPAGRIRGGERVTVFADDIRMTVMAHAGQPSVRITLSKFGRRKFNPDARPHVDD